MSLSRTLLHEPVEEQVHVVVGRIFWHGKPFNGIVAGRVSYLSAVVQVGACGDVEEFFLTEGTVVRQSGAGAPVSVDVFRTAVAHTARFVINLQGRDTAAFVLEVGRNHCASLFVGVVSVVVDTKVVLPRRFEPRVAGADVQGVRGVHYRQEIGHGRLRRAASVHQVEAFCLREIDAQTSFGADVEDVADGRRVEVVALIVEYGVLRAQVDGSVEADVLCI